MWEELTKVSTLELPWLNLGWPSEQFTAKQTLFPPLAHIPLPWKNLG